MRAAGAGRNRRAGLKRATGRRYGLALFSIQIAFENTGYALADRRCRDYFFFSRVAGDKWEWPLSPMKIQLPTRAANTTANSLAAIWR